MSNTITGVYIDSRDFPYIRNPEFNVPTANVVLDAGDLWVATSDSQMLVIERKTPSDLLGSISDGRLFNQVTKMKKISPWCYVVVCGSLLWDQSTGKIIIDYKVTGWDMSAVWGALLTVQELGAGVVFCANDDDFVLCVKRLAKRERGEIRIHPVRPSRILSAGETLLASLPGIGIENTSALLKHCGTPAYVLSYLTTTEENHNVIRGEAGIKRAVRKALKLEDEVYLTLATRDENEKDS